MIGITYSEWLFLIALCVTNLVCSHAILVLLLKERSARRDDDNRNVAVESRLIPRRRVGGYQPDPTIGPVNPPPRKP